MTNQNRKSFSWILLITVNVTLGCWWMGRSQSNAQPARAPFGNSVQQRGEMIRHLQEVTTLLKEQNTLLRKIAGKLTADEKKQP